MERSSRTESQVPAAAPPAESTLNFLVQNETQPSSDTPAKLLLPGRSISRERDGGPTRQPSEFCPRSLPGGEEGREVVQPAVRDLEINHTVLLHNAAADQLEQHPVHSIAAFCIINNAPPPNDQLGGWRGCVCARARSYGTIAAKAAASLSRFSSTETQRLQPSKCTFEARFRQHS